ncbi:MAG TPA: prepilin-type N-terminal cleavage/methylation domain-containing protein [Bdellovibrionota bacterium]|nr:prepilin-type N-terminal cleavage/methylation domain-containing protein [Bdellovibrionota bacterium]
MPRFLNDKSGFTLLETMIAMAIMMVAFASILAVESGSINASNRAKQLNIVAMLAKNQMIEAEYEIEGKTFEEVKKKDGGNFAQPYQDYRWTMEIKEIKFPSLNFGGSKASGGEDDGGITGLMTKLLTNYISKAIRELTVTIFWKKGPGEQSFSVSTYWVDLNHEFELQE